MLRKHDIDLCILDFDETLVRSQNIKNNAFKTILGEKYFNKLEELIEKGVPRKKIFQKYLSISQKQQFSSYYIPYLMEKFSNITETEIIKIGLEKEVSDFLIEIHDICPLILNSVTPVKSLKKILFALDVIDIFSHVVGGKLPKIDGMKQIPKFNYKDYKNILVIGDSVHDKTLANNLDGFFLKVPNSIELGYFYNTLKNKVIWDAWQ